ncbi:MAG: AAA family ATPase [Proteobacteria bacterium]|nr:AAA family ATPase [Pseudomonadota bacterium]
MYLSFYGLAEKPFSITPDPRYLFLGGRHAEALAHLVYGISEAGGFIQLTGEVGTGKTTIIRSLLAKQPDNAEIALILNPRMNAPEFMLTLCEELGILLPDDAVGSVKELVDILNRYLLKSHAQGKRVVLIVDEAQNLAPEVLEQVRLLTNLETETQKLLQIILIGQPELRDMLARNDLRQLAQRITGRYHLDPLSREESSAYVKHRLRIAGATTEIFTGGALTEMYRVSGGVPRLLNVIGDRALLGGYSEDRHIITASVVRKAASEVFGRRLTPAWLPWVLGGATAVVVAGVIFAVWQLGATRHGTRCRDSARRQRARTDRHGRIAGNTAGHHATASGAAPCAGRFRDAAAQLRRRHRPGRRVRAAVRAVVGALCGRLRRCVLAGAAAGTRMPERDRRHRGAAPLQPPGAAGAGR